MDTQQTRNDRHSATTQREDREAFERPKLSYVKPKLVKRGDVSLSTLTVACSPPDECDAF